MMVSTTGSAKSGPTTPTAVSPAGVAAARAWRSRRAAADSHRIRRRVDRNRIESSRDRVGPTRIESARGRVGATPRGRENGGRPVQGSNDGMQERRWRRGDSAGEREGRGAATALGTDGREREDRLGFVWRGQSAIISSTGAFLQKLQRRVQVQKRCGRGRAGRGDTRPGTAGACSRESKRGRF
jgi:hypothetical protein